MVAIARSSPKEEQEMNSYDLAKPKTYRQLETAPRTAASGGARTLGVGNAFEERRHHSRIGALTLVEDVTYSVLRKHEFIDQAA